METMLLSHQITIAGIAMQFFPLRNFVSPDLLEAADMYINEVTI